LIAAKRVLSMAALWQDTRYALRIFRRSPGFTAVALLTLALGVGANTAIFSVVNGVLLAPLPYPDSQQLVSVARTAPRFDHPVPVSGPNFLDWRNRARQFESMSAVDVRSFTVTLGGEPEQVIGAAVSSNFFHLLKTPLILGRSFLDEEEHFGHDHVTVLTYGFWKEELGGDPSWIGRALRIGGESFQVVGVLPRDFRYVLTPRVRMFTPLKLDTADVTRGYNFLNVLGRLKPGVSLRQAQAEMDAIARALAKEYPTDDAEQGAVVIPLLTVAGQRARSALLIMLAAVGLVLLIACVNIGNLLLAQAAKRQGEFAVRAALGAKNGRLARQCLSESLLLGVIGGLLGLLLGYGGLRAFLALTPDNLPRIDEVSLNGRVVLFSFGISLLCALLFGLAPASRVLRANLSDTLKQGAAGRTSRSGLGVVRRTLVVAQIALSLVLLAGAGLAIRSFATLLSTDPGYDARNLLTFYVSPPVRKASQAADFFGRFLERLNALPGATSAAMSLSIPPSGGEVDGPVITSDHPDVDPERAPDIVYNPISANYFSTIRLPLRAGREFSASDVRGMPAVVILNETAAESLFPGEDAIGKKLKLAADTAGAWWTIVGVVGDERYYGWDTDRTPMAYVPFSQILVDNAPDYDSGIVVRTATDPLSLIPGARAALASVNRQMALLGPESMDQRIASVFAPHRFTMALMASLASLALLLAAVGVYGVMSQFVTLRTHEIGIRMALGAGPQEVRKLVVAEGMRMAIAGAVIGLALALPTTRFITSLLYGISPNDVITFTVASFTLIAAVLLACWVPTRRAMRVDPIIALRYE
jgi:predicted permease